MSGPQPPSITVRLLQEADGESLWRLRLASLEQDPQAFAESAEEHRSTQVPDFRHRLATSTEDNFVLGAFDNGALVGMVGFYRYPRIRRSHRGMIWGMYVDRQYRGDGVGRKLMVAALDRARRLPNLIRVDLSVATPQRAARALYVSLGFKPLYVDRKALITNGEYIDEEFMVLTLSGA